MDESNKILDVKIIDLATAANAVDVYKLMKRIIVGNNVYVAGIITGRNNSVCSIIVTGYGIKSNDVAGFRNAMRKASRVIKYKQESGLEVIEFKFNLIR